MKQNLHTHTTFCDGNNSISEMISSALHKDFDVLGFSGHSFTYFDKSYCMSEEETLQYIEGVNSAKEFFIKDPERAANFYAYDMDYRKPLRIYLGVEQDLYSDKPALRKPRGIFNPGTPEGVYDYIIGSTHAFRLNWNELEYYVRDLHTYREPDLNGVTDSDDGVYLYVDYSLEAMEWAIANIFKGDPLTFAEWYFLDEGRIVDETDCDIVGHFDLLTKFNEQKKLFEETSPRFKRSRDHALEMIFRSFKAKGRTPIFEINTGAMAKGYRTTPYPSQETLGIIREMGGRIVINSDCHKAELLDYCLEEAERYALNAGFKRVEGDFLIFE